MQQYSIIFSPLDATKSLVFVKSLEEQDFYRNTTSAQTTDPAVLPWDTLNQIDCAKRRCKNLSCNAAQHTIEASYTSKDIVTYQGVEGVVCQGCWTLDTNNKPIPCGSTTPPQIPPPPPPPVAKDDDGGTFFVLIILTLTAFFLCYMFLLANQ